MCGPHNSHSNDCISSWAYTSDSSHWPSSAAEPFICYTHNIANLNVSIRFCPFAPNLYTGNIFLEPPLLKLVRVMLPLSFLISISNTPTGCYTGVPSVQDDSTWCSQDHSGQLKQTSTDGYLAGIRPLDVLNTHQNEAQQ
jgi:hypothetical protein